MFRVVFSSEGSIKRGEVRSILVEGNESASVEVSCFVGDPPEYKPCDECGQFIVSPGLPMAFSASRTLRGGDELHILVRGNESGETQRFRIPVSEGEMEAAT
jgi:hypothetical protein